LLIFFHGNSEDVGHTAQVLREAKRRLGIHILAVEYPGYGICSGAPSEEAVMSAGETVLRFVHEELQVPLDRVMLMGRSLGGGPAIYLASKNLCAGLVTMSTFSSIQSVVSGFAGWGGWFPNVFDNLQHMRSVSCKTLIVHGSDDGLIPAEHATELANACGRDLLGCPSVTVKIVPGAGHNGAEVTEEVIACFRQVFREIDNEKPLSLVAANKWLRMRADRLASDVIERVPYAATWTPEAGTGHATQTAF
jgi:pimeloyl-ACP methyl ester carboxylesterase